MTSKINRSAYTLLEVLLALGIGVLLLAGLYVSMDVQVRLAQDGRDRVDESVVGRAVLTRMAADIQNSLTPIRSTSTASASTTSSTGTGSTSASGSTTTTTTTATTSTVSGPTADPGTSTNINAVTPLNGGVSGETDRLTLFTIRVPGSGRSNAETESAPNGGADVRRVTYWLVPDQGLARQEISRVTGDDEGTRIPPDVNDPAAHIIAPEVVELRFQFYDGTAWVDTWEGTTAGDDGATPIGPPRAVKIVLTVAAPDNRERLRTYTHVVAIQSANAQPAMSETTGTTP